MDLKGTEDSPFVLIIPIPPPPPLATLSPLPSLSSSLTFAVVLCTLSVMTKFDFFIADIPPLAIAIMMFLMSACWLGFWLKYFVDCAKQKNTKYGIVWNAYNNSFPFANLGFVMPLMIATGIGIIMERTEAVACVLACGALIFYNALLDITFNAQQGFYHVMEEKDHPDKQNDIVDVISNYVTNGLELVIGPIWFLWALGRMWEIPADLY